MKLPSLWTYRDDHLGMPIGTTGIQRCAPLMKTLDRLPYTQHDIENTICIQAHTAFAYVAVNTALNAGLWRVFYGIGSFVTAGVQPGIRMPLQLTFLQLCFLMALIKLTKPTVLCL
ncbi:hypothetical protein ABBQ32_011595 [Trebouxia sp. C0010 RCD-2024]